MEFNNENGVQSISYGPDDEERKRRRETKEKRSVEGMEKRWRDQDRADLEEAERLNAPPIIVEPKCHVCQSPHRLWIERQLMKGVAYTAIANSIPNGPDRRSISTHYKNHMQLESALVRAVLEEEAGDLGQNLEEGVRGAFSIRGALNVMIRKAYDDAMNNITTIEPRDWIQMAKLYQELDSSASVAAAEEAKAAVRIYTDAIKNVFTDLLEPEQAQELSNAIIEEIKRLREIDEIDAQVENQLRTIPPRVPSAS